jgi:Domain of unknown function (DUF5615)
VSLRFQADADLNQVIVLGLLRREPAIDFKTATEAGLEGLKDPNVLALAAAEGRILVTHDIRSMPGHFATFIQTSTSPGVFLIPQHLPVAVALEELLLLWSATEPAEWINQIVCLPL